MCSPSNHSYDLLINVKYLSHQQQGLPQATVIVKAEIHIGKEILSSCSAQLKPQVEETDLTSCQTLNRTDIIASSLDSLSRKSS